MESNAQTELTSKIQKLLDSKMTAIAGERLGGGGIEQNRKRTHGHGQQCGDCTGKWV